MDRILINDLLVRCFIGVTDGERRERQDVLVNIELGADLRLPGKSDRIEDAVDYSTIKKKVLALAESSRFSLIEALAEAIAAVCLEHPAVEEARVRVEKPAALRFARSAGVEITRRREHA